jgi:hypothetical protein
MPAGDTDASLLAPRVSGVSVVQRLLAMSPLPPAGYNGTLPLSTSPEEMSAIRSSRQPVEGWPRADRRRTCLTGRNQPAVITHERSLKRVSPNRLRHKAGPARHVTVVPTPSKPQSDYGSHPSISRTDCRAMLCSAPGGEFTSARVGYVPVEPGSTPAHNDADAGPRRCRHRVGPATG